MEERKKAIKVGLAGCLTSSFAEICTFPTDTIKTRIQTDSPLAGGRTQSAVYLIRALYRQYGVRGYFIGATPAILRQGTYSGVKMALYEPIRNFFCDEDTIVHKRIPIQYMIVAGMLSGGIGTLFVNPFELLKTRMQSQRFSKAPLQQSMASLMAQFIKNEGLLSLWRVGAIPAIQRNMTVNASELTAYDFSKQYFVSRGYNGEHTGLHILCSVIAGLSSALAATPFDLVKTRIMTQNPAAPIYRGTLHCMSCIVREEGVLALWRGFLPHFMRLGPWAVIFFVTYEKVKRIAGLNE